MTVKPVVHGRDHRPGGPDPSAPGTRHNIGDSGEPAFQNSWANIGGDSVPMHFLIVIGRPNKLNAAGDTIVQYNHKVVEIAGDVTGGTNGTAVFTIPLAYQFEEDRPYPAHDSLGDYVPCRLYANGEFVRGVA
jgi:hypothetical protein